MNRKVADDITRYIRDTYGVDLPIQLLLPVIDHIDGVLLSRYFCESGDWEPEMNKFKHTGWDIVERVNALTPRRVLDVGCGHNLLKGKIDNLYGIDPYNGKADQKCSILDFETDLQWDVVLCLGSVNFGSVDKIFREVQKVVSLTSPGGSIFFRVNPGITHPRDAAQWIDFFDWSEETIRSFADELGCEVAELAPDAHRLYFRWVKRAA